MSSGPKMLAAVPQQTGMWSQPECQMCQNFRPSPVQSKAQVAPGCSCTSNSLHFRHGNIMQPHLSDVRIGVRHHVTSTPAASCPPYVDCTCGHLRHTGIIANPASCIIPLHPAACVCLDVPHVPCNARLPIFHQGLCTCPSSGVVGLAMWNGQNVAEESCTCGYRDEKLAEDDGREQHCRRRLWGNEDPDSSDVHCGHVFQFGGNAVSSCPPEMKVRPGGQRSQVDSNLHDWQKRHLEQLAAQKMEILSADISAVHQQRLIADSHQLPEEHQLSEEYLCPSAASDGTEETTGHMDNFFDESRENSCSVAVLLEEVEKLKAELRTERMKVQFYQVMLERSHDELEALRARCSEKVELDDTGCDVTTACGSSSDIDTTCDSALAMSLLSTSVDGQTVKLNDEPASEALYGCSLSSSTMANALNSDDVNAGGDRQIFDASVDRMDRQCQVDCREWGENVDRGVLATFSSLAEDLARKNRHLYTVRQMLKELSFCHHDLLEKNFMLEDELKRWKQSRKWKPDRQLLTELEICIGALQPIVALCSASLQGRSRPDLEACFGDIDQRPMTSDVQPSCARITMQNVKSLRRNIEDLRHDAINKLIVARYVQ